ncbi:E3 ubiquitin-protein ligase RHF2A [Lactuca sativa]|uniref:RING-type E3 ubiquitin transferase n=1 Tax=Lactuca sativa TaxID=4236 RepID=A0A9R1V9B3_LACSA|nr:E3 ubiquitin-protein ligase RHF2A [Lactuca sativa]KAJ0201179.1 hypothetical protein LSAT_V11C600311850 [Lactuca sativa]
MEVPEMEEGENATHLTSPAAFVEGGIQEACEDSCSICLEAFCDSDPGTVTSCKHEFHLQCILEWCQRSSNCPMCWQAISLKDPLSQELLEAIEQERRIRFNPTRNSNSTIFHHPTLGDFELQHLPVGVNDSELEDRIIQHLAAAAAMGRARHVGRRDGSRNRSTGPGQGQGRPQFLVFSTSPNTGPPATMAGSGGPVEESEELGGPAVIGPVSGSGLFTGRGGGTSGMGNDSISQSQQETSVIHRNSSNLSSPPNQDTAGPSELQTASETWKSKFNAISTRYKESLSKSTRGWKERLFNKSPPSMSNMGSEVRREVNEGIANIIERLEVHDNNREDHNGVERIN